MIRYRSNTPSFKNKDWSTDICACCSGKEANPGFFCMACCCGGIAQGALIQKLGLVKSGCIPSMAYECLDVFTGRSCTMFALIHLRMGLDEKLGRNEGICCSCCRVCCCYACAMAQIDRDCRSEGREYKFDTPEGMCDTASTAFGAVIGDPHSYDPQMGSGEYQPIPNPSNSMNMTPLQPIRP
jgi:hypothetical protein